MKKKSKGHKPYSLSLYDHWDGTPGHYCVGYQDEHGVNRFWGPSHNGRYNWGSAGTVFNGLEAAEAMLFVLEGIAVPKPEPKGPSLGEWWHRPLGATKDNPGAEEVQVVALVSDPKWADPSDDDDMARVVVVRRDGKRKGPSWSCQELWCWHDAGWTKGRLKKGGKK